MTLSSFNNWSVFPLDCWEERTGARVQFDRDSRPICRKQLNGSVEQVPLTKLTRLSRRTWLYRDKHLATDAKAKCAILRVSKLLALAAQISRNKETVRQSAVASKEHNS